MASGKIHTVQNTVTAIIVTGVSIYFNLDLFVVTIANILGIWITPDIDHDSITVSETAAGKVLYKVVYGITNNHKFAAFIRNTSVTIMSTLTYPISYWFTHRSFWTHVPPFSVFIKLVFIFFVTLLFNIIIGNPLFFLSWYPEWWWLIFFFILCIHDGVHTFIGDGGMVIKDNKKLFLMSKSWYTFCRKLWGSQ